MFSQEYIDEVESLSQDILFSLQTNFPVSVLNEMKLCNMLSGENTLEVARMSPSLMSLHEFFLEHECERAWNLKNLLIGI